MKKSTKELSRHILLCLFLGITILTGVENVYAQAEIINIEKPNEEGISINCPETFHVEKEGLILNNATEKTTTKLSSVIEGNTKLNGKSADIILEEIKGTNLTEIKGNLEVAGSAAAVIIANPNGITVNGASFFNTKSIDLWAGKTVYADGHLTKQVEINDGYISIGKDGLIASDSDVHLAARTMKVDGAIKAKNIDIRTNQGIIDFNKKMEKNKKSENPRTRWIDISEMGGMYANTIYIESQEDGTAFCNNGNLDGTEEITVIANGDIEIKGKILSKNTTIKTENNVNLAEKENNENENIESADSEEKEENSLRVSDPKETIIYTGNNGNTVMDITTPDKYGISVNKTDALSVTPKGFIFNNAINEVHTKIGGTVKGNQNLMGKSATLIIAEAYKEKGKIEGTIEIAGKKADIIIANPYGIEIKEGDVINANRMTILSGMTYINKGKITLLPASATMIFAGGEWNTKHIGQTNIIGNNIIIDGKIKGENLNILIGNKEIDYQTGEIIAEENHESNITVTDKGSIDGKNISIFSDVPQMNFIQRGELHGEKLLRIDMKGAILHQGYSRGLVTEMMTKGEMKNEGIIQGERVEIEADTLLNGGSLFAGDLRIKGKRIENAGEREEKSEKTLHKKYNEEEMQNLNKEIDSIKKEMKRIERKIDRFERFGETDIVNELEQEWDQKQAELQRLEKQKADMEKSKSERNNKEENEISGIGIIYGASAISLHTNYLYNQKGASLYSDGLLTIQGFSKNEKTNKAKLIQNHGGSIYSNGNIYVYTEKAQNTNADLRIKTKEGNWEEDPDRIEIDAPGSDYNHVIATKDHFKRLEYRLNYDYIPYIKEKEKYPYFSKSLLDEFIANRESDPDDNEEEMEEWDRINDDGISMLSHFGITKDESESLEDSKLKELVESKIKEKYGKTLDEYDKMWQEYNKVFTFANYWEIHSKHRKIETELLRSLPGTMVAEQNLQIEGTIENSDSLLQAGKGLYIKGTLQNKATVVTEKIEKEGKISHTQPHSYWHWGNHTKRAWSDYENYKEPDDEISYYLPTVTYTEDTDSRNQSAMTEGEIKAKQDGTYTMAEENNGNGKNLVMTIHHDNHMKTKQVSSLVTAKEIYIEGNNERNRESNNKNKIENEGTLLSNTLALSADDLTNHGTIGTKDLVVQVKNTLCQTGDMTAEKKLTLDAGNIIISTEKILTQQKNEKETAPKGLLVTGEKGLLYLHSQNDIQIKNQYIGAVGENGTILLDAQRNITLDTETYTKTIGTTESENNVRTETTDSGNVIEADGNFTIQSKGDMTIKASSVRSAKGDLRLLSENDIHITTGKNTMDAHYYWRHEQGGTGSKRGNHTSTENKHKKDPIVSELLGKTVTLAAKRDIHLLSANTINRNNTKLKAGKDIISSPDTTLNKAEYNKTFDGSGIGFGGGFLGIRIGSWNEKHKSTAEEEQPVPTTITTTNGTVDLEAEGNIHATTTYIYGRDGVTLTGANITLDGIYTKNKYSQTDAYRFDGITIGIGGQTMQQLQNAYIFGNNAFKARDKRLTLLEGKETWDILKNIKEKWNKYEDKDITLTVAVTHNQEKQNYENIIIKHEGGGIGSEGNITLKVKDTKNGEIKLIG